MPTSTQMSFNRPEPKLNPGLYNEPPPPANPAVRGYMLQFLASIVSNSSFVQGILWKNAGFTQLRSISELYGVEARYDPTVIPKESASNGPESSYYDISRSESAPSKSLESQFYSIQDYHEAYKPGTLTPTKVAESLINMIQDKSSEYSKSFLVIQPQLVREAAAASTKRYKEGKPLGPLDGVPIAVKDEVDVKGYTRCLGTTIQYSDGSIETSWCVKQWEEEGAVLIGKLTMHELGLDTTNNNPNYGTPLNPYNNTYYTGGSSGGSAYAVASGLVPLTLGADGGGSIRIPAAYCGVYGLKPSHGRISARPTPSLATSTGVTGPIAANMDDLATAYRIMAKPDADHPTSSAFSVPSPPMPASPRKNITIGIFQPWLDRADPPVHKLCQEALAHLRDDCQYPVVPITIPFVAQGQVAHAMTIMTEILSCTPPTNLARLTAPNRILMSVAKQHTALDVNLAQRLRGLLMSHLAALFDEHPGLLIVTPTTPNAGWMMDGGVGDLKYGVSDANKSVRSMEYVWLSNFTGCPSISVPMGYVEPEGSGKGNVPVGLMAMAEWGAEDVLLSWGYDMERYLNEVQGRKRPDIWADVLGWGSESK